MKTISGRTCIAHFQSGAKARMVMPRMTAGQVRRVMRSTEWARNDVAEISSVPCTSPIPTNAPSCGQSDRNAG